MTAQVYLALFGGGTIGLSLALHLGWSFAWVGALLGGLLAYIVCDYQAVLHTIPVAWRQAVRRRNRMRLRVFARNFLTATILYSSFWPIGVVLLYYVAEMSFLRSLMTFTIALSCASVLLACLAYSPRRPVKGSKDFAKECRRFHLLWVYGYFIPWLIGQAVWQTVRFVPRFAVGIMDAIVAAVIVCARFIRHLFVLIHSELRLMCLVDTALGVLIGYPFGHPIAGGIAAVCLGAVNHYLIARRWLGVTPR